MASTQRITECSRLQAFGLSLQMAFVTAAARASAAPTGPAGPDGHLANTHNVIRNRVKRIWNTQMSKKNLIFTTIVISILCSSTLIYSLDVPEEAREVAEAYLKLRGLNTSLGDPYPRYVMDSQDLQGITEDEFSLIANARFVCYDFPYFINGKPKGMVSVRNSGEEWKYYKSSGQEPLYDVIYDLQEKKPDSEISLLSIDRHKFFAVVALKDKFFVIPKNKHTQDLFKGTIYEGEEFPWISYSIAYPILKKYASSHSDKGCIKHKE